jgi:hypothetical protein
MNRQKLQNLWNSARSGPVPAPTADFASQVMRAIRREAGPRELSVFDHLAGLFPRMALGAAAVIGLCATADICLSSFVQPDLSTGAVEVSEQWLFAAK